MSKIVSLLTIGNTSYSTYLQRMRMVARVRTDFTEAKIQRRNRDDECL